MYPVQQLVKQYNNTHFRTSSHTSGEVNLAEVAWTSTHTKTLAIITVQNLPQLTTDNTAHVKDKLDASTKCYNIVLFSNIITKINPVDSWKLLLTSRIFGGVCHCVKHLFSL